MIRTTLKEMGFANIPEMLGFIVGLKSLPMVVLQISAATLIACTDFIGRFIYQPPSAVFIIVALILSDTVLTTILATREGKPIDLRLMTRMFPTMLAHLAVMSAAFHFSLAEPVTFAWLPSAVFGFFGMRNFLAVIQRLVRLGLLKGELLEYLNKRLAAIEELPSTLSNPTPPTHDSATL